MSIEYGFVRKYATLKASGLVTLQKVQGGNFQAIIKQFDPDTGSPVADKAVFLDAQQHLAEIADLQARLAALNQLKTDAIALP